MILRCAIVSSSILTLSIGWLGMSINASEPNPPQPLIGYSELRTNLPGGRHANISTGRALLVNSDGTGRRPIADALRNEVGAWTQFAGWSPDGQWVLFVAGEHYNCHPHLVRADGTELRKLADRGGYQGVRNLYVMRLADRAAHPLTNVPAGHAAMHAYWQPQ